MYPTFTVDEIRLARALSGVALVSGAPLRKSDRDRLLAAVTDYWSNNSLPPDVLIAANGLRAKVPQLVPHRDRHAEAPAPAPRRPAVPVTGRSLHEIEAEQRDRQVMRDRLAAEHLAGLERMRKVQEAVRQRFASLPVVRRPRFLIDRTSRFAKLARRAA